MIEQIEIDVTLTKSEIARYNFYHIRWLLTIDFLGFLALIAMTYLSIFIPSPGVRNLFGSFLFWGVLLLAAGLSQPFILFLQIFVLKNPAIFVQTARRFYRFATDGIHIKSDGKAVLTTWNKIVAVKDIGRLILVSTSPKLAYVIPKRCLGSNAQVKSFTGFLLERIKQAK